jgi:tetratricopeptide (TPR) repeat protein
MLRMILVRSSSHSSSIFEIDCSVTGRLDRPVYSRLLGRLSWIFFVGLFVSVPYKGSENPVIENARQHPENFSANHIAGEHYLNRQEYSRAVPYLEAARRADPANYANSYDLALAYQLAGAPEKSRDLISALLKRQDKAELHNLLGDVEEAEGHVDAAARQYEIAARLDPSEKNLFDLGSDLLRHRGFDSALKVFQFGAGRHSQSARLRVGLGVAYYSLGRFDEAVQALCEAVDLDPRDTKALDFLGKMYDISPQYAKAISLRLARFATLYPTSSAANYYYGLSLRKRSSGSASKADQSEAEKYLVKAVTLQPDFADAHYELGLLYEDQKRDIEAAHQYELAAKLQPALVKAHYRLARLYRRNGQNALAEKEFRSIQLLKSNRPN